MAKKRVTIYVDEEVWRGIRIASLSAGKSAGDYLVSMHLKVGLDEVDLLRTKGVSYDEMYRKPEMPNIKQVEEIIKWQSDKADVIAETRSKIEEKVGVPFQGGYSKDRQLGKKKC
jgi:hypothetical protein